MRRSGRFARGLVAPALAVLLLAGGCADRVELHGKIFEAAGLTNKPKTKPEDVPTRAPLVVPPNRNLPQPGQRHVEVGAEDWPDDPNERLRQAEVERQRKLEEYREKGDFTLARGIDDFEMLSDHGGRRPGLFGEGPVGDAYRDEEFRAKPEPPPPGPWSTQTQGQPAATPSSN